MALAAKLPNGDVVLVLTEYEANAATVAQSQGPAAAADVLGGRGARALARVTEALQQALRKPTNSVFDQR